MTPRSFDAETSREVTGDERSRGIEAKARADADLGVFDPPKVGEFKTYWGQCQESFALVVYESQYAKRIARNARKADPSTNTRTHPRTARGAAAG
jgi:hypothetical protein